MSLVTAMLVVGVVGAMGVPLVVNTEWGPIQGFYDQDSTISWRGWLA